MARIKIDLTNGIFEIEGDEKFVATYYEEFKPKLATQIAVPPQGSRGVIGILAKKASSSNSTTKQKKAGVPKRKETYTIAKDLDLSEKNSVSLKKFYVEKDPQTALEKTTVFVYYLTKFTNVATVNANHIYTCYKEVGSKVPTALKQNILDVSHRKGTIDTSNMDNISLTTRGENMVELDLPAKTTND